MDYGKLFNTLSEYGLHVKSAQTNIFVEEPDITLNLEITLLRNNRLDKITQILKDYDEYPPHIKEQIEAYEVMNKLKG